MSFWVSLVTFWSTSMAFTNLIISVANGVKVVFCDESSVSGDRGISIRKIVYECK